MKNFIHLIWILLLLFVSCSDDNGDDRYFINPDLEAGCLELQYPDITSTEHVLPWKIGESYEITGNCNTHGGFEAIQKYAYDIAMPIGTSIVATRSGTVIGIEEGFLDFNGSVNQLNYVFIQHEDNTISRYYHLTKNGALVGMNDQVSKGQVIALSGGSGNPGYSHLHFDLVSDACIEVIEIGNNFDIQISCQTIAVVFSNTTDQDVVLEIGKFYKALPY